LRLSGRLKVIVAIAASIFMSINVELIEFLLVRGYFLMQQVSRK